MLKNKEKILGKYKIRKTGNANSVTIPIDSGFKIGDNVLVILKENGDLEIQKEKKNFWDEITPLTAKEKEEDIEDLEYNPVEQEPIGKERIDDES
ncbi:hypothetical protein [uncultured Lactobacillus sp.]|mgnify:CR=1 FL=1|uniref:hypothetical protein n=1 Tax=uncultured Lactobacillus sp. TaxID=153152 RepID=UPI002805E5D1|nr:hypothetical protein [uncultured Lactobacillus sp.]